MHEITLSCGCGSLQGKLTGFEKTPGNHLVCYCKDCQAFPTHLHQQEVTLDSAGGTRIYQVPPANVQITLGHEHLACLQFNKKGLIRWYAACCKTPIGNTVNAKMPFVGLIHTFIKDNIPDPIMGCVHKQSATANFPAENKPSASELLIIITVLRRLVWWKLTGKSQPNPLFLASGKPVSQPKVLLD